MKKWMFRMIGITVMLLMLTVGACAEMEQGTTDYLYLFENQYTAEVPDAVDPQDIRLVVVYKCLETDLKSALIDFEKGMVYADRSTCFFDDVSKASVQRTLDDDMETEVRQMLAGRTWSKWKKNYLTMNDSVGGSGFGIEIETDSGIFEIYIAGSYDESNEELLDIVNAIAAMALESNP